MGTSLSKQLLWLHAHEQTKLHAEMMSWIASAYESHLCMILTWSHSTKNVILYGLRAACHWWSVHSCCDKQEVRCHACLNLSCLCYGRQRYTLAIAICPSPVLISAQEHSIFEKYLNAHLKFTVYGRKYKCVLQCSPASVGLAQARPNYRCVQLNADHILV